MKKDIRDYLHLYMGCNCILPDFSEKINNIKFKLTAYNYNYYKDWHSEIQPILRPLSSMTEEEITELFLLKGMTKPDKVTRTEIKDRFLQIEYIHSCVYGSDYQHIITMYPDQFAYLLSKSFDLFHLIEDGLALDITKQPGQHNEQYSK